MLNSKSEHPLSALRSPLSALRSPLSALSLIAALFIPFNLQAEETGGFLGFTIGQMDFDYDVPAQFRRAGISLDDRVLGWKFLGGYHFNEYFGAELAYVDARELPIKVFGVTLANLGLSGFTFAGVFRYPLTSRFNLFVKGGGFIWSADAEAANTNNTAIVETDGISYVAGAGAEFEVIENLSLRAEWERLDADGSIDFLSLGLLYNF